MISERHKTYIHLTILALVAMLLRLVYLKLASDNLGFIHFAQFAPDSQLYRTIADHILSPNKMGGYGLLRVGPGYALILAGIKVVFGSNLIWPILFSIVMGTLAPVAIYLLAFELLKDRTVAFLAGAISALSLTSVVLSTHILTDQPFFTMQAAALICFVRGYRTRNVWWFLAAGLIAGFGAYVRPMGQIWPVVFLFLVFVIPVGKAWWSRRQLVLRGGVTGLVMLLMVVGWSARNYAVHGLFTFGSNGMLTVRSVLVSQMAQRSRDEGKSWYDYRGEWELEDGDRSADYAAAYGKARARVVKAFEQEPGLMLRVYLKNLGDNLTAGNIYAGRQVPAIRPMVDWYNRQMKSWLGWVLVALSVIGIVTMALRRLGLAAWILGATYASFSLLLGASAYQGSRLHYPGEIASSILVAYLAVLVVRSLRRSFARA